MTVRELRTSEGWCVQQEADLPGQKSEPCSSDGRMAGVSKAPKVLKPIDKISLGEITSHRAVTTVNANVASKVLDPRAEPPTGGRRQHGVPKSDRRGILTSAGWKRQHGDKDTPSGW